MAKTPVDPNQRVSHISIQDPDAADVEIKDLEGFI
jgi:hypothetical protein